MPKNKPNVAGKNAVGSSSQAAQGPQAPTKNEAILLSNWAVNLKSLLENPSSDIKSSLDRYKGMMARDRSEFLMSTLLNNKNGLAPYESLTHLLLIKILNKNIDIMSEKISYQKYIEVLKLFMSYGAKPSQGDQLKPVFEIYSARLADNTKNMHGASRRELIEIMSSDPKIFEIVESRLSNNLLHAASLRGDIDSILYVVENKPELVNRKNDSLFTILVHLITNGHDEAALQFINNAKPNLTISYPPGFLALHVAIQHGKTRIVEALLRSGSPISALYPTHLTVGDGELLLTLSKAGYFLSYINIISLKMGKPFFCIESGGTAHPIGSVEDLEQCKATLSDEEKLRLHMSFMEVKQLERIRSASSEKMEEEEIQYWESIAELYNCFSEKFPMPGGAVVSHAPPMVRSTEHYDNPQSYAAFFSVVPDSIAGRNSDSSYLAAQLVTLRDYLQPDVLSKHTSATLVKIIASFNSELSRVLGRNPLPENAAKLFEACYLLAKYMLPRLSHCTDRSELIKAFDNMSMIILGAGYTVVNGVKSQDSIVSVLESLSLLAEKNGINPMQVKFLKLVRASASVGNNMHYGFHDEISQQFFNGDLLDSIMSYGAKDSNISSFLLLIMGNIVEKISVASQQIDGRISLIKNVITASRRLLDPNNNFNQIIIPQIIEKADIKKTNLEKLYFKLIDDAIEASEFKDSYKFNKDKTGIKVTLSKPYDKSKLKVWLEKNSMSDLVSPTIEREILLKFGSNLYRFMRSLACLESMDLNDIAAVQPQERLETEAQSIAASDTTALAYHLPSHPAAHKNIPSSSSSSASSSGHNTVSKPIVSPAIAQPSGAIEAELREKLGLHQAAKLFALYNKPGINDGRKHLFWAVWFDHMFNDDSVSKDDLNRFMSLLENGGKFATHVKGDNGIRSVDVIDSSTNKLVPSLKMKLVSKDVRIYASPTQTLSNAGEVVNVYLFGQIFTHKAQDRKDNKIAVDPRKFMVKMH